MRLDTSYLEYLTKDELRVLVAVEMGMKNHEFVPMHLIEKISKVKRANAFIIISNLLKNKLVTHTRQKYDGYKLTYLGYDFLALSAFYKRGTVTKVFQKIGVGKESDIYRCQNADGNIVILKLARLGRTSFRTVKNNRDYLKGRTQYNWLYLSRLASVKEFAYMQILHQNQFPTPKPIDWNRHAIVMSIVDGHTLCNVAELGDVSGVYKQCIELLERFASFGLIHSDFNEFNLMIKEDMKIVVIDFPQMVSTSHLNADYYFGRDLDCINTFFHRRFKTDEMAHLELKNIPIVKHLDQEVKASGFVKQELNKAADFDVLEEYQNIKEEGEENEQVSDDDMDTQKEQSEPQFNDVEPISSEHDSNEDQSDKNDSQSDSDDDDIKQELLKEDKQEMKQEIKQSAVIPDSALDEVDNKFIKKVVKKKFRNKQIIRKNINKNKDINIEERIEDIYL